MRILRRVFVESAVALGVVAMAGSVFLATAGISILPGSGVGLAWLPIVGYLLYLLRREAVDENPPPVDPVR